MLRSLFIAVVLLLSATHPGNSQVLPKSPCCAQEDVDLSPRDKIKNASVTISIEIETPFGMKKAMGSGTLFQDKKGTIWCLTAAHVVELRDGDHAKTAKVAHYDECPYGKSKVTWVNAVVAKVDADEDIALLQVGEGLFPAAKHTKFYLDKKVFPLEGTPILHCGTFAGTLHHSVTKGEITALGRTLFPPLKDQADLTGFPGSSGGGIFTTDGRYIGMLTHGYATGIILFTPMRRIQKWAEKAGVIDLFSPPICRDPIPNRGCSAPKKCQL